VSNYDKSIAINNTKSKFKGFPEQAEKLRANAYESG
jgi:hypothetical protein